MTAQRNRGRDWESRRPKGTGDERSGDGARAKEGSDQWGGRRIKGHVNGETLEKKKKKERKENLTGCRGKLGRSNHR